MKETLFLTLLLIFLSCKKDEPIKSYLSEPPVLKGFNIRDDNGVLVQKLGIPNVKYSEDPESEKKTFVYKTTINATLNATYNAFYIFFGDKSSDKYKVTVVRGIVDANIANISSIPNTVISNQNLVVFELEFMPYFNTSLPNTDEIIGFLLPQNISPGVFRVYIDYGDYILYDNIIIE